MLRCTRFLCARISIETVILLIVTIAAAHKMRANCIVQLIHDCTCKCVTVSRENGDPHFPDSDPHYRRAQTGALVCIGEQESLLEETGSYALFARGIPILMEGSPFYR